MINIEKFIRIRKKQNFSQTELAQGICTQATLSRFENLGDIPTYKILSKLCARLKIEVGDIMFSSQNNPITSQLNQAEVAFIDDDYSYIQEILTTIDKKQIQRQEDYLHFVFLEGYYELKAEHDPMRAAYDFNTVLLTHKLSKESIFYQLALLGLGCTYEIQNNMTQAQKYYEKLNQSFTQKEPKTKLDIFRYISMFYHSGNFLGKNKNYKESNSLLNRAFQLGKKHHVSYYMAKVLCRRAANDIRSNQIKKRTRQYLNDACAFARFNQNSVTLNRSKKMLRELDEKARF